MHVESIPVNHRRSPRLREAVPIRFVMASEDYRLEHEALTMDRSLRGARVLTAVPLSSGEVLVAFSLERLRSATVARVVWVRGGEGSFMGAAGLEFLDSLPR